MLDLPPTLPADDPLAQPTRRRLFTELSGAARALTTAELASRLQLHPNGIRAHLGRLAAAGLIVRDRPQPARGRPADAWAIAPGARPAGRAPSAYEDLGRWLARALSDQAGQLSPGIERAGREIGEGLTAGATAAEPALLDALAGLGFEPTVTARAPERISLRLCNCPYRAAARENRFVVCALHRGITRGLVERLQPGAELERFDAKDPDQAGCELVVAGFPAARSGAGAAVPASGSGSGR